MTDVKPLDPETDAARRVRFLRRIFRLASPYWSSARKWRARSAAALLFALTVAQVGLAVWTNYWNRRLFDALEDRAVGEVLVQTAIFALIFALTIGVTAAHLMVKRWLQLDWRAWLTETLVGRWMHDGRHYLLRFRPGEHDNPDGRIAEDIRIATETALALAHTLVYSLLTVGLFVGILWDVSGALRIPGTDVLVQGYMVPLAFLYAGVGAVIGWGFGRPLVRSTDTLQSAEADFRFGLARARERGEGIALMGGEHVERESSSRRFGRIVRDWNRQSLAYMGIVSFSTGYGVLLPVFPILIAAPQYIYGAMSLGMLMQAAQAFQRLTSSLSWLTDNLGDLARTRASAERVLSLYEDIRRLERDAGGAGVRQIRLEGGKPSELVIDDLQLLDPAAHALSERFSCRVTRGERMLIAGDPAVTDALFKALAGLWPWGSGSVFLPPRERLLFMAHRPLLPEGTLRSAICYPGNSAAVSDAALRRALECAGLLWLAPRLDQTDNWEQALPLRTQQRIGCVRALIQRPAWIIMEEATDALDPRSERLTLEMLFRELPDTGVVTISFHTGLESLHARKLVLNRREDPGPPAEPAQSKRAGSQPRSTQSRSDQAGVVSVR
jgi:putative ATP-binding cassette transporter